MTRPRRDPISLAAVHGGGKRGVPFRVSPVEIAAWNAANKRARDEYRRHPNAVTLDIWKRGW